MNNLPNNAKLHFDIRAEVLGRLLADKFELDWEQILFRPVKFFQRWGRRDVIIISDGFSMRLEKKVVWLEISREGMMDILPEDIFGDQTVDSSDDQAAMASKFCLPFEQLFYWLRLENERRESEQDQQLEKRWWSQFLSDDYQGWFPLSITTLEDRQKNILYAILPFLSDIIGNWKLTGEWLSMFMEAPIRIAEISPPEYPLPEFVQKRLGDVTLGQDFIIGSSFCDGIPNLKITIDGLTAETIGDFLLDGKKRILMETELLTMLLPVEIPYEIELTLKEESDHFQLGVSHANSVLGFTTVL